MPWTTYPQAWRWFNFVLASTSVFWLSDLDLDIAALFYDSSYPGEEWWLERNSLFYYLFYKSVPVVSVLILLGSLGIIAMSFGRSGYKLMRKQATYILLVFLLGPGLLVNAVFKDHWGRPRPSDIQEFGGTEVYNPPLKYVVGGSGLSFPSGHSSIGFAFLSFWFLWRRRKPLWAKRVLVASLAYGGMIGLTRMSAGGHFLSDVIWSVWVVLFVAWLLDWLMFVRSNDKSQVGAPR